MTVEDFILVLRSRGWTSLASWIQRHYQRVYETLSDEMKEHLKRRARQ